MKVLKKIAFSLLVSLLTIISVNAEGNVAKVNDIEYDTIEKAMTAAEGTGYEVILLQDVTLAQTKVVEEDLIINLNGHSIKRTNLLFEVYGAEFTIKGNGSLEEIVPDYAPVAVYGSPTNDANFASIINIEDGVTLKGWAGIMVREYGKYSKKTSDSKNSYGIEVNFAGEAVSVLDSSNITGSGIYVNGNILHTENAPVINVLKTAKITSMGVGILGAGYSIITVEGGTIIGDESGIEVRAGELYVKDGSIKSTANKLEVKSNNNGSTTIGAGIAVAQHNTANILKVEVNGGKIEGFVAFHEANPEGNLDEEIKNVTIKLNSGTFTTTNTSLSAKSVLSENKDNFIYGGTYNVDAKDYLKENYTTIKENNNYVVYEKHEIRFAILENVDVEIDKEYAAVLEKVTLTLTPKTGFELSKIVVIANDNTNIDVTKVTDNEYTFVMPDDEVAVVVKFTPIQTTEIPVVGENAEVGAKDPAKAEEVLLETLDNITDETIQEKLESTSVNVGVEITEVIASEEVNKNFEDALINEKIKDATVLNFFDITISVKDATTKEEITTLTDLTKPIELMVAVPELEEVKEGYVRNYYIIKEHNGKVIVIKDVELTEDGKHLVFESNEFSTYALAYNDTLDTKVPNTGDNVLTYVSLGFISIGVIALILNNLRKRELNK